jgi:RNA polymerase sigma-70 factor (ECF subfamily)
MVEDAALLEAARKLDRNALVAIFEQYAPPLYKYALRLSGDPAEADDVVGDVFSQLIDHLKRGKGPRDNLRSYLYQIAYHKVVDGSRQRKHTAALDDSIPSGPDAAPSSQQEDNEQLRELQLAISRYLTEDQRNVIVLRFMEHFSLQEIVEITGRDINNVKVIQSRAVARLRQALSGSSGEDS